MKHSSKKTYKVIRMYAPGVTDGYGYPKPSRIIREGLTLEEAQEHCQDPTTRQEGEWFDGYDEE